MYAIRSYYAVSHIATLRNQDSMYDFIVITKNNKLLGTVSIKDILQKITEVDIQNAKNQNPLTELPGNKIIEQHLKDCLEKQQNKSVIYIDIDNFKAYNDVYGFEKGDMVIKFVSQLLKEYISENVFVGHIGGDDFVVISNFEEAENICSELLHNFKDRITSYNVCYTKLLRFPPFCLSFFLSLASFSVKLITLS